MQPTHCVGRSGRRNCESPGQEGCRGFRRSAVTDRRRPVRHWTLFVVARCIMEGRVESQLRISWAPTVRSSRQRWTVLRIASLSGCSVVLPRKSGGHEPPVDWQDDCASCRRDGPASRPRARSARRRRKRVRHAPVPRRAGVADAAAGPRHDADRRRLDLHHVPARGLGRDADRRPARRHVRQEAGAARRARLSCRGNGRSRRSRRRSR